MDRPETITNPSHYDDACLLSKIFFFWHASFMWIGLSREPNKDDFFKCPSDDEALKVTTDLERNWNRQIKDAKSKGQAPSLLKTIIKTYGLTTVLNCIFLTVDDSLNFIQTFLLGLIVRYFSSNNYSNVTWNECLYYSIGLTVTIFSFGMIRHHVFLSTNRQGLRIRTALTVLVYKKLLKMSRAATMKTDIGYILNVISNDLSRFDDLTFSIMYIFIGPFMAVAGLIYMINILGLASLGLLVVLVFLMPFQAMCGKYYNKFRRETALLTDKRIKSMEEMISSIKIIKMFTWEQSFADIISKIRKQEMVKIYNSSILRLMNIVANASATRIMVFACLLIHVILGRPLTPELVFITLSLCNSLKTPVTLHIGLAIGLISEARVSIKRIQDLLLMDDKKTTNLNNSSNNYGTSLPKGSIKLDRFRGKWDNSLKIDHLKDVSLKLEPGELLLVIGTVGSSKTCLMMALLDEIVTVSGSCIVSGKKSYSPQEPWTFAGTIRQNILFGRDYNEKRYRKVIDVCSLRKDLKSFPYGDNTWVGEKGYTLSGGQKARVTLARAVYEDADVYLLDDPLSAVDPGVAEHLFDKCINGYLKEKTRVLITHQLQFLKRSDKILIMNEGQALAFGTFKELNNIGIDFIKFLKESNEIETNNQKSEEMLSIDELYGLPAPSRLTKTQSKTLTQVNSLQFMDPLDEISIIEKQMEQREEKISSGSLKGRVYLDYLLAGGNLILIGIFLITSFASQGIMNYVDLWLSNWSDESLLLSQSFNETLDGMSFKEYSKPFVTRNGLIYLGLIISLLVGVVIRLGMNYRICLKASETLHNRIFSKLLRTPIVFFENNPVGRILNRFTRDIGVIDVTLAYYTIITNSDLLQLFGLIIITAVVLPYVIVAAIAVFCFSVFVRQIYLKSARFLSRVEGQTRSPIYDQIASTYEGLTSIRAFQYESQYIKQFYRYLNDNNSCKFMLFGANRLLGVILDFVMLLLLAVILTILLTFSDQFEGGKVGLILSTMLTVFGALQWTIRNTSDLETYMIAVERVLEYGDLPSEPSWKTTKSNLLPSIWPDVGNIKFDSVYFTYPGSVNPVLKNLTFDIKGGEKIGIVGRTGAGKSSLISVLFRLSEFQGNVLIDNIDIQQLGLHDLRKKISIIPQDPLLFTGTIRSNLDPLSEQSDESIWSTLKAVNLSRTIESMPGGLDAIVTQGGSNLSLGQRQLLCLIRALLQRNRIMILDEATANMDHQTDSLIQETIRKEFKDCTVLTVAHRLNTIIDMDKIILLDAGQLIEYGEPYLLLKDENSHFKSLVSKTGPSYAKMLFTIAEKSYRSKHVTDC
ncbi:ATP-binding cassette sub-family C member 4-like isoform X1 [Panonychus citri]|uniref:ATP-binding cassette sub-family C member 4-like isoform X1 n=2 Tax=Panonychus citri TaxID=50023 RepID=UPI00230725A2|nr:ATP-binding cassette sub-family C member 4-like isoform X1 [Panonychus citri]